MSSSATVEKLTDKHLLHRHHRGMLNRDFADGTLPLKMRNV